MKAINRVRSIFFYRRKKLFILLFLIALFLPLSVFSQQKAGCIIPKDLIKIYREELSESTQLLTRQGWMLLSDDKNVELVVDGSAVTYHLVVWSRSQGIIEDYIYLYYYEGLSNYVEWITNHHCYSEYSRQLKSEFPNLSEEKVGATSKIIFPSLEEYRIMLTERKGSHQMLNDYFISVYNKAEMDSLIAVQNVSQQSKDLILKQKKETIERAFIETEKLISEGKLEEALLIIEKLPLDVPEYRVEIQLKRDQLQKNIKEKNINKLMKEGETFFAERALKNARQKYQEVLILDGNHEDASLRIKQIDEMLKMFSLQSTTAYDYKSLNPDNYSDFQRQMAFEIDKITAKLTSGSLDYTFTLLFDSLGKNRSSYEIRNSSVPDLERSLSLLTTSSLLKPTYKEKVLVGSRSIIDIRLDWSVDRFKIKKRQDKVKLRSSSKLYSEREVVEKFLNQEDMPIGRYFFDMKVKTMNGRDYKDISLKKYKTVGPEAIFYSMLFPGAGTLAATQGKKGGWAMASFLVVGGGSLTAYLFHKNMEKKISTFENGNPDGLEESDITKLKKNSNLLKYTSYVGGGISAVIYVSDMFNAFAKGIKNMKRSKELRKALKKEPIEIVGEKIVSY